MTRLNMPLKCYQIESNLLRIFHPVRDVPPVTRYEVCYCVITIYLFIYLNKLSIIVSINRHHKVYLKLSKYFVMLLDLRKIKIGSLKKAILLVPSATNISSHNNISY